MNYISLSKFVFGIISIAAAVILLVSSMLASYHPFDFSENSGGTAPLLMSCCYLLAGIISILTKNGNRLDSSSIIHSGSFTCVMFYFISAILGYKYTENYHELNIWSMVSFAMGILYIFLMRNRDKDS